MIDDRRRLAVARAGTRLFATFLGVAAGCVPNVQTPTSPDADAPGPDGASLSEDGVNIAADAPAVPIDTATGADRAPGRDAAPPVEAAPADGRAAPVDAPSQTIEKCSLGPVGTWQEITPPAVKAGLASGTPKDGNGTFAFAVDPVNSGTVYVGTVYQKMWKSTDCGGTWTPLGTGRNAAAWDHAMNWTFAVDPVEPNVLYTNAGYGTMGSGLYKSTNGGVDWDVVWPPAKQPELRAHFQYNFANVVTLDPSDHRHLVLTFHEPCLGISGVATCLAETFDGGASWKLLPGNPTWNGNEGQLFYFLEDARTWLWASQTNGFFRSEDAGASWKMLQTGGKAFFPSHLQGAGLYRAKDGVFYLAAADGIFRSPDGKGWTLMPNTGPIGGGLASDGTTIFASRCFFGRFCQADTQVFMSSPESDGTTWKLVPESPKLAMGGEMHYDAGHRVLYASTFEKGFWRVVTK